MRTAIAISLCAAMSLNHAAAAAEIDASAETKTPPPEWHVVVGVGAMALPAYPGARSLSVIPLPLVDVRYGDRFFASVIRGVGLNLIAERDWHAGFAISPRLGRSESSDARLRGWGSISAGADARIFAEYRLGPVSLGASVHRELEGSEGMLADASAAWFVPLSRRLFVTASATLTWADARYNGAYFGVTPQQSQTALAGGTQLSSFAAPSGLRDVAVSLLAAWQFDRHWGIQALVGESTLLAAAARSPLTQQRIQPMAGGFLSYSF